MPDFTGTTVQSVHAKEDVLDELFVINSREAVLWPRLKAGREPIQPVVQWEVDDIVRPNTRPINEKSDVTVFTDQAQNIQTITSYRQQWRKTYGFSDDTYETKVYGIESMLAYHQSKASTALLNSIEATFLSDQEHQNANFGSPGVRGLGLWTRSYDNRGSGWVDDGREGDLYFPAKGQNLGGAVENLDVADLNEFASAIFKSTGAGRKNLMIISGPDFALRFNEMTKLGSGGVPPGQRFNANQGTDKVLNRTTLYEGVFQMFECVPAFWIGYNVDTGESDFNRAYFLDMGYLEKAFNYHDKPYDKTIEGNNLGGWVQSRGVLRVLNPKCMGQWNASWTGRPNQN